MSYNLKEIAFEDLREGQLLYQDAGSAYINDNNYLYSIILEVEPKPIIKHLYVDYAPHHKDAWSQHEFNYFTWYVYTNSLIE